MLRELRDHWGTLAENLDWLLGQGPKGWGRGGRVTRKAHWAEGTACAKALRWEVCRWCSVRGVSRSQRAELAGGAWLLCKFEQETGLQLMGAALAALHVRYWQNSK